jgi:hypothetical protein
MQFYLGTHQPAWLTNATVPLFVSHRRLVGRTRLPRARTSWALDSGGFSELSLYGEWRTDPAEYVYWVDRYDREIGRLDWAAPQDWMFSRLSKSVGPTVDHDARLITIGDGECGGFRPCAAEQVDAELLSFRSGVGVCRRSRFRVR